MGTVDPRVLTGEIIVAFGLLLAFREPVTHLLGTANDAPALAPIAVAPVEAPSQYADVSFPHASNYPTVDVTGPRRDPFLPYVGKGSGATAPRVEHRPALTERLRSTPSTTVAPTDLSTAAPTATRYVVRAGDSLWSIARDRVDGPARVAALDDAWRAIYRANKSVIGADPSQLAVGTVLRLPS